MQMTPYRMMTGFRLLHQYGVTLLSNESQLINFHQAIFGHYKALNQLIFFGIIQPNIRERVEITINSLDSDTKFTYNIEELYTTYSLINFHETDRLFKLPTETVSGENITVTITVPRNADPSNTARISPPLFIEA